MGHGRLGRRMAYGCTDAPCCTVGAILRMAIRSDWIARRAAGVCRTARHSFGNEAAYGRKRKLAARAKPEGCVSRKHHGQTSLARGTRASRNVAAEFYRCHATQRSFTGSDSRISQTQIEVRDAIRLREKCSDCSTRDHVRQRRFCCAALASLVAEHLVSRRGDSSNLAVCRRRPGVESCARRDCAPGRAIPKVARRIAGAA